MRALTVVAAAVGVAAVAAATSGAVTVRSKAPTAVARFGEPTPGKVLLGVVGPDPPGFDRLTGKHHALHVIFANFARDVDQLISTEYAAGRLPVPSLSSSFAPADIASGAEDARYVALASVLNASGKNIWVRILPEMNGEWNAWCAFDASGRSRGPKYAPLQFVRAFRRIALILRGGPAAAINGKLRAVGLPPLRVAQDIAPSGKVAIIWNPQGHGTPFIAANGPAAYWPGPSYVDIVADDMYSDSAEPSWRGMEALYESYAKPFLVAEWGLEGEDDTVFASRMFTWIPSHRRTMGLVYFNKGWSGGSGIYELRSKPRSLAIYRRAIRNPRFLATLP